MLFSASGSHLFIGASRPDWQADPASVDTFAGETWREVGGLTDLGDIEGQWQTQDMLLPSPDAPDRAPMTFHEKVARPARMMRVIVDLLPDDLGQQAMGAAEDSEDAFAFRIVFVTGGARSFVALVVAADLLLGKGDTAVAVGYSLILQSNMVKS